MTSDDAREGAAQLAIVANRLPVRRTDSGWEPSPGGLVTALASVVTTVPSAWVGWAGVSGEVPRRIEHEDLPLWTVALSEDEMAAYYDGFANSTLWPLFHDGLRAPQFDHDWWRAYRTVNARFAAVASRATASGGSVWVHDYHLLCVPQYLRRLRPDVRVGWFCHIPFPPPELFGQIPWRVELLEGLLGADLIGFQTPGDCENFRRNVERHLGLAASRVLKVDDRTVEVNAFPISVDVDSLEESAHEPSVTELVKYLRERLGPERDLLVGIDRLDYTKGIPRRLLALRDLLADNRLEPGEIAFVQVAVPTRDAVADYRELRSEVERLVGEINGTFGDLADPVVHYVFRSLDQEHVLALYRAADVMVVTPLRDGMNLVAKEFVSVRDDLAGVLVLSEFTGAAAELSDALLVNPYDDEALRDALERAVHMPPPEQRERMSRLREVVRGNTVHDWANRFVSHLMNP